MYFAAFASCIQPGGQLESGNGGDAERGGGHQEFREAAKRIVVRECGHLDASVSQDAGQAGRTVASI